MISLILHMPVNELFIYLAKFVLVGYYSIGFLNFLSLKLQYFCFRKFL